MAKKSGNSQNKDVEDYRHDNATRKNNPPAGIAAYGVVREQPKHEYVYNPHLPPVLRFDGNAEPDELPELLEKAQQGALSADEVNIIAQALQHQAPWLEWAGKQEASSFTVDPVALHIHERVSAKAILNVAKRENVQRELFADPQQEYGEAVQFYQHDVNWANRLILGDSLSVMSSLAKREDLAGKVQMIYIDPPYGIKFASNFQPTVFKRDVKDKAEDLTREPEQIKAYRDTWTLGIHTYLTYLRDRLIVAKELLTDSGSIFVQISDENLHRVRCIMDEVFGSENFVSLITYKVTSGTQQKGAPRRISDYLLWYAKNKEAVKFNRLFLDKEANKNTIFADVELADGTRRSLTKKEKENPNLLPTDAKFFMTLPAHGQGAGENTLRHFQGNQYGIPANRHWTHTLEGFNRLVSANRVVANKTALRIVYYFSDSSVSEITTTWDDTAPEANKTYVVQTNPKVIQRCLLMTTDPGDLVLDPTCGSGTTAYVAEQWGRRWIMIDTSRVATTLTLQRILTGTYAYYKLKEQSEGVEGGFVNKIVPHITLRSIAHNSGLDQIFAKHEPILEEKLETLNGALAEVTPEIRTAMLAKLAAKERREKKKAITEADRRRWQLPDTAWQEWEVPFDTDADWPEALQKALTDYREAFQAKMDAVNACIAASSQGEELVDQPEVDRKKLRVSGPFTVEAVQPLEESLDLDSPIGGESEELPDTFESDSTADEPANAEAYLDQMIRLLRNGSVRFPDNRTVEFAALDPLEGVLHAEGSWEESDTKPTVAVAFGPEHGPVTAMQVEHCVRAAHQRGYDTLLFVGFKFDGAAQAAIQANPDLKVRIHTAYVNPDVAMNDLLKNPHTSELFTVFGLPRTELEPTEDGEYIIKMEGVDIYNPVDNTVSSAGGDKVAAWFIDSDYDDRTFCITQAFFPDKKAWEKIARALKGIIDPERFEQFSGTESFPFPVGTHARVAVKVIDPRGNEVMQVHDLKSTNR